MCLNKEPFKHEIYSNDHYCIISLLGEEFESHTDHFVLGEHDFVFNEAFDPVGEGNLDFAQSQAFRFILTQLLNQSVDLFQSVEHALVKSFALPDEGSSCNEGLLQTDQLWSTKLGLRVLLAATNLVIVKEVAQGRQSGDANLIAMLQCVALEVEDEFEDFWVHLGSSVL